MLRDIKDRVRDANIYVLRVKEVKKWQKRIFEDSVVEKFPELKKDIKIHQINFTWVTRLNVKGETIRLLDDKIVE